MVNISDNDREINCAYYRVGWTSRAWPLRIAQTFLFLVWKLFNAVTLLEHILTLCCFRAQWGKVTSWPCLSPSVRPGGWDERPASRDFLCLKFGKCWNLLYLQTAEAPYGWCFDPQRFRGSLIWRGSLSMRFLRAPMKHTSWHTELVNMNCLTFSYTSVLAVFWWMDFLHTQGSPFSRQLK